MGITGEALRVPTRRARLEPWRWTSRVVAAVVVLAVALALVAIGVLATRGSGAASTPSKPPGSIQPAGGGVAPAQPMTVGGTTCAQCR